MTPPLLDLAEPHQRPVPTEKATGILHGRGGHIEASNETYAGAPGSAWQRSVVVPNCRGPASTTAGNRATARAKKGLSVQVMYGSTSMSLHSSFLRARLQGVRPGETALEPFAMPSGVCLMPSARHDAILERKAQDFAAPPSGPGGLPASRIVRPLNEPKLILALGLSEERRIDVDVVVHDDVAHANHPPPGNRRMGPLRLRRDTECAWSVSRMARTSAREEAIYRE